jgi:hypothetical protein
LQQHISQFEERDREFQEMTRCNSPRKVSDAVRRMTSEITDHEHRTKQLLKVLPGATAANLSETVAALKRDHDALEAERQKIMTGNAGSFSTTVDRLLEDAADIANARQVLQTDGSVARHVESLILEKDRIERETRELQALLQSTDHRSASDRASDLHRKKEKLESDHSKIKASLPSVFRTDDIPSDVARLASAYESLTAQRDNISRVVPQRFRKSDNYEAIAALAAEHAELTREQQLLNDQIPTEFGGLDPHSRLGDLLRQWRTLREAHERVSFAIPSEFSGGDPSGRVDKLANAWKALAKTQEKLLSVLPSEFSGSDPVSRVERLASSWKQLGEAHERTLSFLPTEFSGADPGTRVEKLTAAWRTLAKTQEKLLSVLPSEFSGSDPVSRVERLVSSWRLLGETHDKIGSVLPAEFADSGGRSSPRRSPRKDPPQMSRSVLPIEAGASDAVGRVEMFAGSWRTLWDTQQRIHTLLSAEFRGGSVIDKIVALLKHRETLQGKLEELRLMLRSRSLDEVSSDVGGLLRLHEQVKDLLKSEDIVGGIRGLIECREVLASTKVALECGPGLNPVGIASRLVAELKSIRSVLQCQADSDPAKIIRGLHESIQSGKSFITQIIGLLTGSDRSPVSIEFPLPSKISQRLLNIVEEFKKSADATRAALESVFARARIAGYLGNDVREGVDLIVKVSVDQEQQKGILRMREELASQQALHERQRQTLEKRNKKLGKDLEDQRGELRQAQEKAFHREDELQSEISREQQARRLAQDESEAERKIHEELMRAIAGQSVDVEYLRRHLSIEEMRMIETREVPTRSPRSKR